MKKIYLLLVLLFSSVIYSQTNGITYQAVILNPEGEHIPGYNNDRSPLVNTHVCLRFKIYAGTTLEYQENLPTTTDEFGMVNVVIGAGTPTGGTATTFNAIVWNGTPKSLVVEVDLNGGCNSFIQISNQPFTSVPYAMYAANSGTPGATGPAGPAGPQGATGAQGPQGIQGATGANGNNGLSAYQSWVLAGNTGTQAQFLASLQGATGPAGPQGAAGINGTNGTNGADGATGPAGPQGPIGLTGAQGIQGIKGDTGLIGAQGPQGIAGTNGTNGATGPQGPIGLTGPQGLQGVKGETGLTGTTGAAGVNGTNGTNGLDGKNTLVNTTTEPAGTNCVNGGTKIEVGLNANNNGVLDVGEVNNSLTKYVCNGNGSNSSTVPSQGVRIGFSSSTTWTCPSGVTQITVELWAGGGGGGGGGVRSGYCNCQSGAPSGGSGGRGGYLKQTINVTSGMTYTITVGSGGSGGVGSSGYYYNPCSTSGTNGENSSFNVTLSAIGGTGGGGVCDVNNAGPYSNGANGIDGSITNYSYQNLNISTYSYIPTGYLINNPSCCANGGGGGIGRYNGSGNDNPYYNGGPGCNGENGLIIVSY